MATYTQVYVVCPWCEQESGHRVCHLFNPKYEPYAWGPWTCEKCRCEFRGSVNMVNEVTVERVGTGKPKYGRALALLLLDGKDGPVYFVMDRRYYTPGEPDEEFQSHEQYFFEEHSCPTNWLRDCEVVIQYGDQDPHGFLTHVRSVEVTDDFDTDDEDAIRNLFPECFPPTIDNTRALPSAK